MYVVELKLSPQAFEDYCDCDNDTHSEHCTREYKEFTVRLLVGGSAGADNGTEESVWVDVLYVAEFPDIERTGPQLEAFRHWLTTGEATAGMAAADVDALLQAVRNANTKQAVR